MPDDPIDIPISAIEHYSYCPRQCALIHVEQVFEENLFTIRGQVAHERVEAGEGSLRDGVRVVRSIPLWSERLGIHGKADVVEFRREGPFPIEYKVGVPHGQHADLQLCAQALCLEEMLQVEVRRGAIYHHRTRARRDVVFDAPLRQRTEELIGAIRGMLERQELPAAPNDARCPNCSLIQLCMPSVVGEPARLRSLQAALFRPLPAGAGDA